MGTKMSHKRWGPFLPDDERDDGDPHAGGGEEWPSAFDAYVQARFDSPEYHRIYIGLKRLSRMIKTLEDSWQYKHKQYTLIELENMLSKQHEIEKEAEKIQDNTMREYIYGQLDAISARRRHIAQEIRWDIECSKAAAGATSEEMHE
jgi:hypothetical protein